MYRFRFCKTVLWLSLFIIINVNSNVTGTDTDFKSTLGHIKHSAPNSVQENAVKALISRLLPDHASNFEVHVSPERFQSEKDSFHIEKTADGLIKITATTGVSAATGFHYYLKYFCRCHVSWEAEQLELPEVLPEVNVSVSMNDRFRYYQNVCTTSYSFVWWNWTQWEKHIDWMALNSFNLVLAFNGQEAIWKRVYKKLNLTDEEIDEHMTGPAFLSWGRMGNIRGWGGPLPRSWHDHTLILQKKILSRMRELGMIPVLPAFAGLVPRAFKRIFPNVTMMEMERWNSFDDKYCCPYLLDPTEELFGTIGNLFIEELKSEFGTDHVYNCDTFNEMVPTSSNLTYLADIGKSVYKAMTGADPQAIWLLQGWMFYSDQYYWDSPKAKALLQSIPLGKMIVLDLQSEQFPQYQRLEQYFGQPYIWCMLHNFGGTLGMFGSLEIINQLPFAARKINGSTMIGTGLTPEGINQNYIVYDLMNEMAWRSGPVNLTQWVDAYLTRRYGKYNRSVGKAWQILKDSVYNLKGIGRVRGKYVITRSPSLTIKTWSWYDYNDLLTAWDLFLEGAKTLNGSSAYLHDLVDITRQVLQVLGEEYYQDMVNAFKTKDLQSFRDSAQVMLDIFDDLEVILATSKDFLLGNWLNSAKKLATNEAESKLYEYNARNQITLWGPKGEIHDYANKQWSGVVSHYFKPRWSLFLTRLNDALTNGTAFNDSAVKEEIFVSVEEPFTFDRSEFPTEPTGDTLETARIIHKRYWQKVHFREERSSEEFNIIDAQYEEAPRVVIQH